jgi:hypothetical protein
MMSEDFQFDTNNLIANFQQLSGKADPKKDEPTSKK